LRVYALGAQEVLFSRPDGGKGVLAAAFGGGRLAVAYSTGQVVVHDLTKKRPARAFRLREDEKVVQGARVALSEEGRYLACTDGRVVGAWDLEDAREPPAVPVTDASGLDLSSVAVCSLVGGVEVAVGGVSTVWSWRGNIGDRRYAPAMPAIVSCLKFG